ncbi:MAG: GxxExxY protein [Prevotella sp.]|nr:GxxExxY protein [Prevotella sp.]
MMNDNRDDRTYQIIGAALEVHKHLGGGFLEVVYGDALEIEFQERGIPYQREKELQIYYKDRVLPHYYKADFICFDSIVVELKAVENLTVESQAQVLNYLAATGCKVGLLLNFGRRSLEKRRFVF